MFLFRYSILLACISGISTTYAQSIKNKDSSIIFSSSEEKIAFSPTDLIASISLVTKRFRNGQEGIEFIFTTRRKENPPKIKRDSIILISSKKEILLINRPVYDTIYFQKDGSLFFSILHYLNKNETRFLKDETITHIMLMINQAPVRIAIKRKSQRLINDFAKRNYY